MKSPRPSSSAPADPEKVAASSPEPRRSREAAIPMQRLLRFAVRGAILVMLVAAGVFIVSLRPGTWAHVRQFDWRFLPLLLGLVGLAWAANGVRTWLLARVLGHHVRLRDALRVTLATEFATAATPGGVGGIAVRLSLQKRLGITRSESASMIAADVTADLLYFALLWPLGALAVMTLLRRAHLDERLSQAGEESLPWIAAAVIAALVFLAIGRHWLTRRSHPRVHAERRHAWRRSRRRFTLNLVRFWRHGKGSFLLCFLVAAVQWTCRYGVLPVVIWAFDVPVDPLPLMLLQGMLFLLSMAVVLPGGGGSVEILSALILPLLVPGSLVGVIVVLWRFLTYHLYVIVGGMVLWRQLHPRAAAHVPPGQRRRRRSARSGESR